MAWLSASGGLVVPGEEVPLALLDAPCGVRSAALAALEAVGRPYRVTATSSSLAGLRAAVRGGIAVTLRTPRWVGLGVSLAPAALKLPAVPDADFTIRLLPTAGQPAADFAQLLCESLAPVDA